MTSIRRNLTVRLVCATLLIAGAGVAMIYIYLRIELLEQFDNALRSRARTLASLVRIDDDTGRLELEFTERSMKEYRFGGHPDYFQVWDDSANVVARSDSLNGKDIARPLGDAGASVDGRSRFFNLALPDGRAGRAIEYSFEPGHEDDPVGRGATAPATPAGAKHVAPVPLVLATSLAETHESLAHVLGALLVVMAAISIGTAFTVIAVVRRGLQPLRKIGDDVARIDPATLATRFDPQSLPEELRPIAEKLNELLVKLDAAFKRERRFTSNVAHELRTPIAELRSLAEVALRWPDDSESAARNFRDTLGIARQMESVVTALLAIARCAAGQQPLAISAVKVEEVVAAAWRPHAENARSRDLQDDVDDSVGPAVVQSDRTVLSSVISNLFANAVAYTPAGGKVWCRGRAGANGERYVLEILNDNDSLTRDDLRFMFEPFWQKDAARTHSSNSGLGLALVSTYAELLGVTVDASLPSPSVFSVQLGIPIDPATPRLRHCG